MYTPPALFSGLFVKICFFVLSLYNVGRLVTLPCENSFDLHHYRLQSEGKVWSVYSESDIALLRPFEVFQDGGRPPSWNWSNQKWRRLIRCPQKPHPRTKHEGDCLTRCRAMAIWNFPKMCEWALRSVSRLLVGRSVVNIHTSYTDLIYSSFTTLGT